MTENNDNEFLQEISNINKQLYEKNYELETVRKLYQIISITSDLQLSADKLIRSVVRSINCNIGIILMSNKGSDNLDFLSMSDVDQIITNQSINVFDSLKSVSIPISVTNNLCIRALMQTDKNDVFIAKKLSEILTPALTNDVCEQLDKQIKADEYRIYSQLLGNKCKIVVILGFNERSNKLIYYRPDIVIEIVDLVGVGIEKAKNYTDLKDANNRLKLLDQMKDELISVTSHELKTPLSIVKNALWMADKQEDISGTKSYIDIANKATTGMIKLVSSILTVSKIEGGHYVIEKQNENITLIIKDIVKELSLKAMKLKIDFELTGLENDFNISIDKKYIHEVIFNIIDNAIKYSSEKGKVHITLHNDDSFLYIDINNKGSYIPDEDKNKLFTKFGRLNSNFSETASKGGTGLGLYISKKFIDAHNGDIKVLSDQTNGTTFSIILPL